MFGGIELGGTKVIVVVGRRPDDVVALDRRPTTTPDETLGWAVDRLRAMAEEHGPLAAVGVAAFGPIDLRPDAATYGRLLDTPKRPWVGADVLAPVRAAFPGVPVGIGSDVDGAALAEGAAGAATGLSDFVYVTIGTGIGMGVVVDGVLVHGILHPEMGHVTVPRQAGDDYEGACFAHRDCLEGMASGTAMTGPVGLPAGGARRRPAGGRPRPGGRLPGRRPAHRGLRLRPRAHRPRRGSGPHAGAGGAGAGGRSPPPWAATRGSPSTAAPTSW